MNRRVFLGSSAEGLDIARTLSDHLSYFSEPVVWTDDVVRPTRHVLESIERQLDDFDYAILVLGPDDTIEKRGQVAQAPRDNVILELGMFIGRLGRSRTFFVVPRRAPLELPTDILGLEPISYAVRHDDNVAAALSPVAQRLKREMERGERAAPRSSMFHRRVEIVLDRALTDVEIATRIGKGLGIHLFVIEQADGEQVLRRVVRRRSSAANPTSWGDFEKGRGVVGICWLHETEVALQLDSPPYSDVTEEEWDAQSEDFRWGMDWALFEKTRQRFRVIGAVPVADLDNEQRGCISINAGTRDTPSGAALWTPPVIDALVRAAETVGLFFPVQGDPGYGE